MSRTFFPFLSARAQGVPVVSAPRERLGGRRSPGQRAERGHVDAVDGGLVGAGRARRLGPVGPAFFALPLRDDRLDSTKHR